MEHDRHQEEAIRMQQELTANLADLRQGKIPSKGLLRTIHDFGEEQFVQALPEIKNYVTSSDETLRCMALHVLTQHFQLPEYKDVALEMMKKDEDEECRHMAISGLLTLMRNTADPVSLTALASIVRDEQESELVRASAYRAMRGIVSYDKKEQLAMASRPFDLATDVDWKFVDTYLT